MTDAELKVHARGLVFSCRKLLDALDGGDISAAELAAIRFIAEGTAKAIHMDYAEARRSEASSLYESAVRLEAML